MAPVKRIHDVISIPSDSGEDDLVQLARPHKKARRDNFNWGPAFEMDDYMAQNDSHTGPIKDERNAGYDIDEYIALSDSHPGSIKDEGRRVYDVDEWLAGREREERMRNDSINDERNAANQAAPGALAPIPPTAHDHFVLGLPSQHLAFANPKGLNHQNDPIIITDTAPPPERTKLDQILDVVPDVSHDHATQLFETHHGDLEKILDVLLEGKYPTESDKRAAEEAAKEAALREQKAAEEAETESLLNPQCAFSSKMKDVIIELLKDEFNTIPVKYIKEVQKDKKHLYATYLALNEAKHTEPSPYGKTPWRPNRDPNFDILQALRHDSANIPHVKQQFEAARKAAIEVNSHRRKTITQKVRAEMEAAEKAAEELNALETAKATGTVVECAACYDEYAPHKVVTCGSADEHPVCFDCMKTYLGSEVGQSSSKLACPGGCSDTVCEPQLRLVPDVDALVDKLMRLRQESDLRTAGIDDVECCPFCDFKTVCLPIDIDFEFHCQSPTCNITSCRKCKEKSHIPDSCEENQRKRDKESALSHRHRIEEARSKALIRNCNKCKQPFIKSDGCNKMTCPQCGNLQCYLCGVDVTANYAHFHTPNSKCPVYSTEMSLEDQHAQEVKAAAETAQAEVLREHPELDKEDLDIKFFDNAAKAENGMAGDNQNDLHNDIAQVINAGDVARRRRRRHQQPQGPPAVNNPAPPPPAPVLPPIGGDHRVAYDPVAAVRAARNRLGAVFARNPNAQQANPARPGGPDPALGLFDFGLDGARDARDMFAPQNGAARAGAQMLRPNDPHQVPANQAGWMANYRDHRGNDNRRQAPAHIQYLPVQRPRANIVQFIPLPAPIPIPEYGAQGNEHNEADVHALRYGNADPW